MYLDVAILLNFLVDYFLLVGANRLSGFPPGRKRAALAAGFGSVYAVACLRFPFLGSFLWRIVSLGVMGMLAYGVQAFRRSMLFVLLSMALGGIALGLGKGGFFSLISAAAGVGALCLLGFRGKVGASRYVPVELTTDQGKIHVTALLDTGNTLTDPVTGQSVLVLGADAACRLAGLTRQQLADPVKTMTQVPGLRLIPYRAVGRPDGMLLAMRVKQAKIGEKKCSALVAFAPESVSGTYQALIGGIL